MTGNPMMIFPTVEASPNNIFRKNPAIEATNKPKHIPEILSEVPHLQE